MNTEPMQARTRNSRAFCICGNESCNCATSHSVLSSARGLLSSSRTLSIIRELLNERSMSFDPQQPVRLSRKHYELIQGVIRDIPARALEAAVCRRTVALTFADKLKDTSPTFDRARFLAGCGVTE